MTARVFALAIVFIGTAFGRISPVYAADSVTTSGTFDRKTQSERVAAGGDLCADVDCSFLDNDCAQGVCDPGTGLCVEDTASFAGVACLGGDNDCQVTVLCDGTNAFCPGFADCEPAGTDCDGGAGLCNGLCECIAVAGACCIPDGSCESLTASECESLGGFYYGNFINCNSNLDPPCEPAPAVVTCVPGDLIAAPGDRVDVEFYVSNVPNLSVYQMAIVPVVDGEGTFSLDCDACTGEPNIEGCGVRIDEDRDDWVFSGLSSITAPNCNGNAGGSLLIFGSAFVDSDESAYLMEFSLDISGSATSGSVIEVRADQTNFESSLNSNFGEFIPFFADSCFITIQGSGGNLNGDGSVDLLDYALLAACFNGPDAAPSADCPDGIDADLDGDGDVDGDDYAILNGTLDGPQ
ncbi:MAG: dockerin type I domain-containing protein [Phycisphaerae bacterium]